MNSNPYSKIVKLIRNEGKFFNPPSILLGVVLSTQPSLSIKVNDLQINKENLLIADNLLGTYTRQFDIPSTTNINDAISSTSVGEHGSHTHSINSIGIDGTINFIDTLKVGDNLAVLPTEDMQIFIILARVVSI